MEDSNALAQWHPFAGPIQLLASSRQCLMRRKNDELPHVLLVLDQFPKMLGGGEKIALRMAKLLPEFGYRVSILTFAVHPESPVLLVPPPCPIFLLPMQKTYDAQAFRAARALRTFIAAQDVQLVQTFFESSDLWAGLVVKMFTKAKLIWSRRDMGILRGRKHRIAYRLMAKLPDRVFAVSDKVRRHVIEIDHVSPDRVETIYNGLDVGGVLENIGQRDVSPRRSVIAVGNIRYVKGFDVLVEAAAIVVKIIPDVHFTIAGGVLEPEYFNRLTTMIANLHVGDRISFIGSITDLGPYLDASEVFVLPSRSEGFSNAIIEAMAHSLPVIATRVGGNDEAVEDGVTGYIVPSEDASALAEALVRVLHDRRAAHEMGAHGKRRVLERFTTTAMMARTAAAYNHLLGTSSTKPHRLDESLQMR